MTFQTALAIPPPEAEVTIDKIKLRPYQREGIDGIYHYWTKADGGDHPLCVIPTGGGKSIMMGKLMEEIIDADPDVQIMSLTHVKELIKQNFEELKGLWPWCSAGIYSAGLKRKEHWHQITFAGIQSIGVSEKKHRLPKAKHELMSATQQLNADIDALTKTLAKFGVIHILIVDECHLIPKNDSTTYGKVIAALLKINPDMKIIGFTATRYRLDSGMLDQGEGAIFDGVAYEAYVADLVRDGFLAPLSSKKTQTILDTDDVPKRGGEFVPKALQEAIDKYETTQQALDEVERFGKKRKSWLFFCAGVAHAEHVAEELNRRGIPCGCVTGDTKNRELILEDFKSGKLRAITNANVLTTGFNAKMIDLIAMLRPTESTGLYIQMLGRGTRIYPGKKDCLVLDFARNRIRHGPFDDPIIKDNTRKGDVPGEAPTKSCPECFEYVHASMKLCPECGYCFTPDDKPERLDKTASDLPMMSTGRPEWLPVRGWDAYPHQKEGKPTSVRVEYDCGGGLFHKQWIFPEHPKVRHKFERFWRDHKAECLYPTDAESTVAVFQDALIMPSHILVGPDGKFFRVHSQKFEQPAYSDRPAKAVNHDPFEDEIPF